MRMAWLCGVLVLPFVCFVLIAVCGVAVRVHLYISACAYFTFKALNYHVRARAHTHTLIRYFSDYLY